MAKKGDLLVTIKGDATSFDKTMTSSTNQIRKMQQQSAKAEASFGKFDQQMGNLVSGNLKGLIGSFGNVAAVLATAKVAQEAFNKTIAGSQTLTDDFNRAVAGAKGGVDYFFQSLATGDWSNFFDGLVTSIAKSKELYDILDALADKQAANKFLSAEENYRLKSLRETITNPKSKPEDVANAKKEFSSIIADSSVRANLIAEDADKAINKHIEKVSRKTGIDPENYFFALSGADAHYNIYKKKYEELEERRKAGEATSIPAQGFTPAQYTPQTEDSKQAEKDIEQLKRNNPETYKIYQGIELMDDEDNKAVVEYQDIKYGALGAVVDNQIQLNRLFNRGNGSGSSSNLPTIYDEGSFAKIDQDIKEWEKVYNEASDSIARNHAQNMINSLKDSKVEQALADFNAIDILSLSSTELSNWYKLLQNSMSDVTSKELREDMEDAVKYLENRLKVISLNPNLFSNIKPISTADRIPDSLNRSLSSLGTLLEKINLSIVAMEAELKVTTDPTRKTLLENRLDASRDLLRGLKGGNLRKDNLNADFDESGNKLDKYIHTRNKDAVSKQYKALRDTIPLLEKYNKLIEEGKSTEEALKQSGLNDLPTAVIVLKDGSVDQYSINQLKADEVYFKKRSEDLENDRFQFGHDEYDKLTKASDRADYLKKFLNRANVQRETLKIFKPSYIEAQIDSSITGRNNLIEKHPETNLKPFSPEEIENLRKQLSQEFDKEFGMVGLDDYLDVEVMNMYKEAVDEMSKSFQNLQSGLYGVGSIFSNINTLMEEGSGKWSEYTAIALQGISQILPNLITLTAAKQSEAYSNAIASGAGQPFPYNLIAIAAGATAVAASIASIPAFADGGIVYGNTIAQVGEYANASSNPEVIAPLSKLKNILAESGGGAGNVQFRIQGKELVGVLDNYSSIKRKR